jgi:hypothetical protein
MTNSDKKSIEYIPNLAFQAVSTKLSFNFHVPWYEVQGRYVFEGTLQ